jgi:hypothetical protein
MLKISKGQEDAIATSARASFAEQMRLLVRRHYPERTSSMSDVELTRAIDKGITNAMGYGIDIQRDVERYIYLMFALGFDFDRDASAAPWAGDILRQTRSSARVRMDMLCAMFEGRLLDGPEGPFFP